LGRRQARRNGEIAAFVEGLDVEIPELAAQAR
jgi:hypothetical protein